VVVYILVKKKVVVYILVKLVILVKPVDGQSFCMVSDTGTELNLGFHGTPYVISGKSPIFHHVLITSGMMLFLASFWQSNVLERSRSFDKTVTTHLRQSRPI
jgi:hypothetical protein